MRPLAPRTTPRFVYASSNSFPRNAKYAFSMAAIALLAGWTTLCAQSLDSTAVAISASVAPNAAPDSIILDDGTEFKAINQELLTSKTAEIGDSVIFIVNEDVAVNGAVVIARGASIRGRVTLAERNGHFGKAGKLSIELSSTTAIDGQPVKLRSTQAKSGDDKTGKAVVLTVLFGAVGLFKHGSNAEIKKGEKIVVYTDEPIIVHPHA